MIFAAECVLLKNGKECILRSPTGSDAEAMLACLKKTAGETDFLTRYPEEVTMTPEEEATYLEARKTDPKDVMIVAVIDEKIVASAGLTCVMDVIKYRHRATLGLAIEKEYWNLGLGRKLIDSALGCARTVGYEQVELEVDCNNERAIKLYQKFGFEIYGTRERTSKNKDGSYSAEYLMVRRL